MNSVVEAIFILHFCVHLCNITEIAGVITLAREVHTGVPDVYSDNKLMGLKAIFYLGNRE